MIDQISFRPKSPLERFVRELCQKILQNTLDYTMSSSVKFSNKQIVQKQSHLDFILELLWIFFLRRTSCGLVKNIQICFLVTCWDTLWSHRFRPKYRLNFPRKKNRHMSAYKIVANLRNFCQSRIFFIKLIILVWHILKMFQYLKNTPRNQGKNTPMNINLLNELLQKNKI